MSASATENIYQYVTIFMGLNELPALCWYKNTHNYYNCWRSAIWRNSFMNPFFKSYQDELQILWIIHHA